MCIYTVFTDCHSSSHYWQPLELGGGCVIVFPEEELEQLMETEPGLARDWDPVYGDRMVKLVFIGQNLDKKAIAEALDACLAKWPP